MEWSADSTVLYYSGGRTCVQDANRAEMVGRPWSAHGHPRPPEFTRLLALQNGGVAHAAPGRRSACSSSGQADILLREQGPPSADERAAGSGGDARCVAAALGEATLAQLRELHVTVTDSCSSSATPGARSTKAADRSGRRNPRWRPRARRSPISLDCTPWVPPHRGRVGAHDRGVRQGARPLRPRGSDHRAHCRCEAAGPRHVVRRSGQAAAANRYDQAADSFQRAVTLQQKDLDRSSDTARATSDLAAVRV